jgi:hypothetical protein
VRSTDVAAVALRSAVPVRPADAAQQAALLGDLCRALGAGTSVRHALDTYRHTVFGATGVETVAVGLVRRDARGTADAAPTPAPRDAGGRHV